MQWLSQVEWRDRPDTAERSREILGESEVRKLISSRFTDSAWFAPNIKQLQKVLPRSPLSRPLWLPQLQQLIFLPAQPALTFRRPNTPDRLPVTRIHHMQGCI